MAYTTIKKPSDYFNTKLYTGNGGSNSITGVGFQPDLTWIKCRNLAQIHNLYDSIRGITKALYTSASVGEDTYTMMSSFDSDGWSMNGNLDLLNGSGNTYANWNWKANGTGVANTDGSISSTVSASATSGFSIVTWSGSGATGTIGHGLGTEPSVIIPKCRTQTADWYSYWKPLGNGNAIRLNTTDASAATGIWNNTSPTSSVFSVINNAVVNQSGHTYVAYCFAEKQGYSKFGSYTGNGSADGTFIYTGFKPSFVMVKRTDNVSDWQIQDNKRIGYNVDNYRIFGNTSETEYTSGVMDFVSNGFKFRGTPMNTSGGTFIYMAFAEEPLVGDNPATAR